jgi:hypothetical protein
MGLRRRRKKYTCFLIQQDYKDGENLNFGWGLVSYRKRFIESYGLSSSRKIYW